MALIANAVTSEARIRRHMSPTFMTDWSDHNYDGLEDPNVIDEAINFATSYIQMKLTYYTDVAIAASELCQQWGTWLAICNIYHNRGAAPPEGVEKMCEKMDKMMQPIVDGTKVLPDATPENMPYPVMVNRTIDRRRIATQVRVERETSTPVTNSNLPRNYEDNRSGGLSRGYVL